jgi:hypothetical protein
MKKIFLLFSTIFVTMLMISTVTAAPKINSDPLMDKINEVEETKKLIDEKLDDIDFEISTLGLIDILIQIIQMIIAFVQQLINIILDIFGLIELIEYLISLIITLFELIMNLINFIIDLFNPNAIIS